MPRPQPPAGFVVIGPGAYMSLPPSDAAALEPNDSAPNLILIFGWMGALTRHLEHYSQKYSQIYPNSAQIIVKCDPSVFWASKRERENRLRPIVKALESLGCLPSNINPVHVRPRVLVHAFSNGGGFQLTSLSRLFAAKYLSIPSPERHVSALILDSSPAIGDFRTIGKAFSVAIKDPVFRCMALPVIYIVHAFCLLLQMVFGWETASTRYYRILLQPRLLPWMSMQTPRLYVFSKKDDLVSWEDVQRHAETAKASGLTVRCEVYEESAHVAHMRLDPNRYWRSIQDLWQVACRQDQVEIIDTACLG